jgi:hypothetical protein
MKANCNGKAGTMNAPKKKPEPPKHDPFQPSSVWMSNAYQPDLTLADYLSDTPEPTFWNRWFGGWILPLALAAYAVWIFVTGKATFFADDSGRVLTGGAALADGLAWLCIASFCHFHYFWPALPRLGILTDLGRALSLVGFLAALGCVVWCLVA